MRRRPTFIEATASTDEELHALLETVIARFMKMPTRRGVLVEEMGQTWLAEPDTDGEEARTVRSLQAAAITYRIAFGPHARQKVLTLRAATPRESCPNCGAGELNIIAAILERPVIGSWPIAAV